MAGLDRFCETIQQAGVSCEVWVNGSFMTEKKEPKDVDIVVRIEWNNEIENDPAKWAVIQWAEENHSEQLKCDNYVLMEYPETHSEYHQASVLRSYWRGQFGFNRANDVKGIAIVQV